MSRPLSPSATRPSSVVSMSSSSASICRSRSSVARSARQAARGRPASPRVGVPVGRSAPCRRCADGRGRRSRDPRGADPLCGCVRGGVGRGDRPVASGRVRSRRAGTVAASAPAGAPERSRWHRSGRSCHAAGCAPASTRAELTPAPPRDLQRRAWPLPRCRPRRKARDQPSAAGRDPRSSDGVAGRPPRCRRRWPRR